MTKPGAGRAKKQKEGAVTQAIRRSGHDLGSGGMHLLVIRSRTAQGTSY